MEEIGENVPSSVQKNMIDLTFELFRWNKLGYFPGVQPTPLSIHGVNVLLKQKKYFVSEKSDGSRYLCLILNKQTYIVDPGLNVRAVKAKFPIRSNLTVSHHKTLLDGELVKDKTGDNQFVFRYLVHDIIALNGSNVGSLKLPDRLKLIQNDVIWPRKNDTSTNYDYNSETFRVRMKDFFELKHLVYLLDELIPALPHPNEGLIFTPLDSPYFPEHNKFLFKWKPPHLNSVDFQLCIEWRQRKPGFKLLITEKDSRVTKEFSWITLSEQEINKILPFDGKIVECTWDPLWKTFFPKAGSDSWEGGHWETGGWRFYRPRFDKKYANNSRSVDSVIKSIDENITKEKLINALIHDVSIVAELTKGKKRKGSLESSSSQESLNSKSEIELQTETLTVAPPKQSLATMVAQNQLFPPPSSSTSSLSHSSSSPSLSRSSPSPSPSLSISSSPLLTSSTENLSVLEKEFEKPSEIIYLSPSPISSPKLAYKNTKPNINSTTLLQITALNNIPSNLSQESIVSHKEKKSKHNSSKELKQKK